jgi:hypothetical protein
MAEIPSIPKQAVRGVGFEVVPHLLRGIELRRIRRELFQMQSRVSLAHRLDGRPPVNRATVPEQDDVAPQVLQERTQEAGHIEGLKVARLEAEVQPQMLAFGRDRKGGQSGDTVMPIVVRDDWRVPAGAQVRRRVGMSSKPLSSRKTR